MNGFGKDASILQDGLKPLSGCITEYRNEAIEILNKIDKYSILEGSFGGVRRNKKGMPVWSLFKQIFCWFYDGTSRHLNSFDQLNKKR